MRTLMSFLIVACFVGCGNSDNASDMGLDMSASADLSGSHDMTMIAPFNMPGQVFCYGTLLCATNSATPVCCDAKTDGGFSDTCTSAATCAADTQATAYACGQAADCGSGMVCCGDIGMSSSGKKFFKGTSCAASCTSAQTQLCVTAGECKASGVSCVGQAISGRDVGLCQ